MRAVRLLLFLAALATMLVGASGVLSPVLSTVLWLLAALLLAGHPSSPILRAMTNAVLGHRDRPRPRRPA